MELFYTFQMVPLAASAFVSAKKIDSENLCLFVNHDSSEFAQNYDIQNPCDFPINVHTGSFDFGCSCEIKFCFQHNSYVYLYFCFIRENTIANTNTSSDIFPY